MSIEDDEVICRVCRCEGTPDHPLFHPCKCSGSIKYVHQECLTEWLEHSKKKYCELCKHTFSFTPIYDPKMPQKLPWNVFIKRSIGKIVSIQAMWARALLVATVWLGCLPYITVWVWRFYFWSGDKVAYMINGSLGSLDAQISQVSNISQASSATPYPYSETSHYLLELNWRLVPVGLITKYLFGGDEVRASASFLKYKTIINLVLADVFEGQIITCVVVVVFVAAFLLREWIIQNTPPEIEEQPAARPLAERDMPVLRQEILRELREAEARRNPERNARDLLDDQLDIDTDGDRIAPLRPSSTYGFGDPESAPSKSDNVNGIVPENRVKNEFKDTLLFENDNEVQEIPHNGPSISDKGKSTIQESTDSESQSSSYLDNSSRPELNAFTAVSEQPVTSSLSSSLALPSLSPSPSTSLPSSSPIEQPRPQPLNEVGIGEPVHGFWNGVHGWFQGMWNGVMQADNAGAVGDDVEDDRDHPHGLVRRVNDDVNRQDARQRRAGNFDEDLRPGANNQVENDVEDDEDEEEDEEEEEDDEAGDDLDGVMEALGMRGSLAFLFQNSALMALLISLCLGVAVYSPYMIGKTLLIANIFMVLTLPIALIRYITDPTVDAIFDHYLPSLWRIVRKLFLPRLGPLTKWGQTVFELDIVQQAVNFTYKGLQGLSHSNKTLNETIVGNSSNSTVLKTNWHKFIPFKIDKFIDTSIFTRVQAVGIGSSTTDRVICISVGYAVATISAMLYVSHTRNMYGRTVGRALQEAIKQQGVILKVAFFVTIELVIFPIGCGILLDLATLPLFPNDAFWTRIAFHMKAPLTSIFLHWFMGTAFMFHFAVFVSLCRENVRPGVMWFIRDPNDPQFHPIREILERPVFTQLRKIGASGIMYSFMIILGIGTVIYFDYYAIPGLLPLRLHFDRPLTNFPLDLLICHMVVPLTINYLRPKRLFKNLFTNWWKVTSRQLRLTSFMFGGRLPEEEGTHKRLTTQAKLTFKQASTDIQSSGQKEVLFVPDGGFAKAPAYDGIPVIPGRRILIPVTSDGKLLTQEEMDTQDHPLKKPPKMVPVSDRMVPASDGNGNAEVPNSHVVVYIPPNFRRRVFAFLMLMWFCGAVFSTVVIASPLAMGRFLFAYVFGFKEEVHDLYSFAIGFYVGWAILHITYWIYIKCQRGIWGLLFGNIKANTLKMVKVLYYVVTFGGVIPVLTAWVIELYILFPVGMPMSPKPLTHFAQSWAFGVLYLKIGHKIIIGMMPENRVSRRINFIFGNGILRSNIKDATMKIITPLILGEIALLLFPLWVGNMLIRGMKITETQDRYMIYVRVYPVVLSCGCLCIFGLHMRGVMNKWMENVRDDEFLVGRELHNLEIPSGSDDESRTKEGDDESRTKEGDDESRTKEGDDESRTKEGDAESRTKEGDDESRTKEGDDESRTKEGDDESRTKEGDDESRTKEGDDESRTKEGDDESRTKEGDDESRTKEGDDERVEEQ